MVKKTSTAHLCVEADLCTRVHGGYRLPEVVIRGDVIVEGGNMSSNDRANAYLCEGEEAVVSKAAPVDALKRALFKRMLDKSFSDRDLSGLCDESALLHSLKQNGAKVTIDPISRN